LAKVLRISDSTVRAWRDEEGIHPRPHHNTGRRTTGSSAPWAGKPARPVVVPIQDHDDDDDEEEEEEMFELDEVPSGSHAANLAQTWETIGKLPPLFRFKEKPSGAPRPSLIAGIASPTSGDPRARLGAITAELNARKPHGPQAVELLVEAAPYLTGGVTALRQYGEARGCRPEDVAVAERIVIAQVKR
jgi:hypothetical protein